MRPEQTAAIARHARNYLDFLDKHPHIDDLAFSINLLSLSPPELTSEAADLCIELLEPYRTRFAGLTIRKEDGQTLDQTLRIGASFPNMNTLSVTDSRISHKGLRKICDHVRNNPNIHTLQIIDSQLYGEQAGQILRELIRTAPHLMMLDISGNPLEDEALEPLISELGQNSTLVSLKADKCRLTDRLLESAGRMVHRNSRLAILQLAGKMQTESGISNFWNEIHSCSNYNLRDFSPFTTLRSYAPHSYTTTAHTRYQLELYHRIDAPETLGFTERAFLETRRGMLIQRSIDSLEGDYPDLRKYYAWSETLPGMPDAASPMPDALFAPDESGYAPLDNPLLWRDTETVFARLDAAGVAPTPELLHRRTPKGTSFIESALHAAPLSQLLAALNARQCGIRSAELVDGAGKPNDAFQNLIDGGLAPQLFIADNWVGGSLTELGRCYHALPEVTQGEIRNYHLLRAEVSAGQPRQQKGR